MGKQTTLWLLLVAALAATVVWWQRGREFEGDLGRIDVPLFDGVDAARVRGLRVDHQLRGNFTFERDARGDWSMTDPIAYPADPAVMRVILDSVTRSRAVLVASSEADPAALGLAPPQVVLVVEELIDGVVREQRLELGMLDLDGQSLNVRIGGRILRTLRTLHTTLERSVDDYRSRRLLDMLPHSVVTVDRSGALQHADDEAPVPLGLNAVLDAGQWLALAPHAALLDPLEFSVIAMGAATLRVEAFVDDDEPDLGQYGLGEPTFSLELGNAAGSREALHFGQTSRKSDIWYVQRAGWPHVWRLSRDQILRVTVPFEYLLDRRLLRVERAGVDALVLSDGARTLRVERSGEQWNVRVDDAPPFVADTARVEDTLSRLEQAELSGFDLERRASEVALEWSVLIEAGGRRLGGRLGATAEEGEDGPVLIYRRLGDDVLGLAEPWLGELVSAPADRWRSLELLSVEEIDVVRLTLRRGERARSFIRGERGRWTPAGEEREAVELLGVLDPLLFLRAVRYLQPDAPGPLELIEVNLERRDGSRLVASIGRGPEGAAQAVIEGRGAVLRAEDLHRLLDALLAE